MVVFDNEIECMKYKLRDRYGYATTVSVDGIVSFSEWEGYDLVNSPTVEDVKNQKLRLAFDFWLCVDEDGREQIMSNSYGVPPVRSTASEVRRTYTLTSVNDNLRAKCCGIWIARYTNKFHSSSAVFDSEPEVMQCALPKGTIKRLIGRKLTWNDPPVLLLRDQFTRKQSWWKVLLGKLTQS